jgi:hypothetical protein
VPEPGVGRESKVSEGEATMFKKLLEGAVLKKVASRTPVGAAVVIGGSWYLRHRRAKRAEQELVRPGAR